MTCSGVTGNKSEGRCFSLLPTHYRVTNIGTTLCIQLNTMPQTIDDVRSGVTPFLPCVPEKAGTNVFVNISQSIPCTFI